MNNWQMGTPPVGKLCYVWHYNLILEATHDGQVWRAIVTGRVLQGVTHWMVKREVTA